MCCLGAAVAKCVLKIANIIAAIGAFILIILASIAAASTSGFGNVIKGETDYYAVLAFFAVSVFLLSRLGCCGARRENRVCLFVYSGAMLVIFVGQLYITSTLIHTPNEELKQQVGDELKKAFEKDNPDVKKAIDVIQVRFECCGVLSKDDYKTDSLPLSCCNKFALTCTKAYAYNKGCRYLLEDVIVKSKDGIVWTSMVFSMIELTAAVCGLCLACNI